MDSYYKKAVKLMQHMLNMDDFYEQHPDKVTSKVLSKMLTNDCRLLVLITQQKVSSKQQHHLQPKFKKAETSTHVTPKHINTIDNMTQQEHDELLKRHNQEGPNRQ